MTIGKRLYAGFGMILGVLLILFVVNLFAAARQGSALESVRTIEAVRYQIMENRLNLNNFLLSGDPRDEEKVNKGMADIMDTLKRSQAQSTNEKLRMELIQVESTETSWADNFAKPLLAKRHQVDSGDATVSDLQIFYLQKDPASWLTKSSTVLDQANTDTSKALKQSTDSAEFARKLSMWVTTLGTFLAIIGGAIVA